MDERRSTRCCQAAGIELQSSSEVGSGKERGRAEAGLVVAPAVDVARPKLVAAEACAAWQVHPQVSTGNERPWAAS